MKKIIISLLISILLISTCSAESEIENFLKEDNTDAYTYTYPSFTCINFSKMLISNLQDAGFDARKFGVRSPKKKGHIMVFVYSDSGNVLIEPQTDQIWRTGDDADGYIYDLLGYNPTIIQVSNADGMFT